MNCKKIFEALKELGHIQPGNYIPRAVLENLIGVPFNERLRNIEYLGPCMELKNIIDHSGYICHICRDGSIRIIPKEHMSYEGSKIWKAAIKKGRKVVDSMTKANIDDLAEKDRSKHLHETNKMLNAMHAMNSVLSRF
jgi:hypothetical protein